jgi:putative transposase
MLPRSLDERLLAILGRNTRARGCVLVVAGCATDHVHAVVRLAASVSLADLVRQLKGASSYELNHTGASHRSFAWQTGYWAESLSPTDLDPVAAYVRNQRVHHDPSHPAERWTYSDNACSWPDSPATRRD